MVQVSEITRVFKLGAVELPDPEPTWTPEQVLAHFAQGPFPQLMGGKVQGGDIVDNKQVYSLIKPEYAANG